MSLANWMKRARGQLGRSVKQLQRRLSGRSYRDLEHEIITPQWLAEDHVRELQWARLKKLLDHAYRTTRYYRELFDGLGLRVDEIQSLSDYARAVPVLEKQHVRENFDALLSSEWRGRVHVSQTGGSTGMPVRYAAPQPYPEKRAMWALVRDLCGLTGNERALHLFGRPLPEGGYHSHPQANLHRFGFYQMPPEGMQELLDLVLEWRPEFIYGYRSLLSEVANALEQRGHTHLGVKVVQSHSEKLHRRERETMERVFGGHVFDHYGCSEINHLGVDCHAHAGIHLFDHLRLFEVDPVGGQQDTGEVIVTDLYNYAMPFLRYRIGDVVTLDHSPCSCGRRMPRATVEGRSCDLVRLRDGSILVEDQFTDMLDPGQVERFLFHQRSLDRIDIRIVPTDRFSQAFGEQLVQAIRERLQVPDVRLFLDPTFDVQIAGKSRLVRSDVSAEMVRASRDASGTAR